MKTTLIALGLFLAIVQYVNAYGSGAPVEVCDNMEPQHGEKIQPANTFPCSISTSKSSLRGGETITVSVSCSRPFKGFIVQMRVGDQPIGRFTINPKLGHSLSCGSGKDNAVTHSGADSKDSLSAQWTAPRGLSETVIPYVTIAETAQIYWVKIQGQPISVK